MKVLYVVGTGNLGMNFLAGVSTSGAILSLTAAIAATTTFTLSFDEAVLDHVWLDDSVGDSTFVDLTSQTRDAFGESRVVAPNLQHLATITPLENVVFPGVKEDVGEFSFAIAPGKTLTIDSFDVAAYPETSNATFRIFDETWTELWAQTGDVKSGQTLKPGVELTGAGYFQFGSADTALIASTAPVGIDNLAYSVSDVANNTAKSTATQSATPATPTQSVTPSARAAQVVPTPLPASAPLILLGLGGMFALRRRKG